MTNPHFPLLPASHPRRRFVQGLMVAGTLGGLPLALKSVLAQAGNVPGMKGKDMAGIDGMNHADMQASAMKGMKMAGPTAQSGTGGKVAGGEVPVKFHYPAEYGPSNAMRAQQVSTRLDDPGVGLRNNGRTVLSYADLHTIGGPEDPREPIREILLHLTGNMDRFMWSFNGLPFSAAEPLLFHYGERLRIVLVNDTMMNHPIHLHGMFSELEAPDGSFQVRKHTITVQPGHRVSYRVSANARGNWAYHCHLLYHMEAGMFRAVVVV